MKALGPQGKAALHDPAPAIRLVPKTRRPSLPSDWEPLGMTDAARTAMRAQEADRLRDRVAELEAENAHLLRQLDAARERGRREEQAAQAKTMGGRLPSILFS